MKNNLTPKQEKFCQKYIELGNATQAYREAYSCSNASSKTINCKVSHMLKKDNIRTRLDELQNTICKKHNVTVDSIIEELNTARDIAQEKFEANHMIAATM